MTFNFPDSLRRAWALRGVDLGLLALALWLRLTHLTALPVFVDEGTHIFWGRLLAAGQPTYPFYMDGRLLAVIFFSAFNLSGANALWAGRAAAALVSVLGAAACLALGRRLGGRWTGWLAGLLYAALPFSLFHDRQMLADTVSAAGGAVLLAAAVRLMAGRRGGWDVLGLAAGLAFAGLTKLNGGLYVCVPVVALLLTPRRRALAGRWLAGLVLAAGLVAAGLALTRPFWGQSNSVLINPANSFLQCPPLLCQGDLAEQLRRLPPALASLAEMVPPYLGWGLLALAAVGGLWPGPRWREAALLGLTVMLIAGAVVAAIHGAIFPRYLIYVTVPLVSLAAHGWTRLVRAMPGRRLRVLGGGLLAVGLAWPLLNSPAILLNPTEAQLAPVDERQYVTGVYAGLGFAQVAQVIEGRAVTGRPLLVTTTAWHSLPLSAYTAPAQLDIRAGADLTWPEIQTARAARRPVYLLDEVPAGVSPAAPDNVLTVPRTGEAKTLRLRAFPPDAPEALRPLFDALFIRPDAFLDAYDQLLRESAADGALVVAYPPHQIAFLRERTAAAGVTLVDTGLAQPWEVAATVAGLPAALPDNRPVRVIFLQEQRLDPERRVEAWLAAHLFHVEERWLGPVRVVDYFSGGATAQTLSAQTRFGDAILLDTVEVLDVPRPGGAVRLRLTWRASAPITAAYKVFVHFFQGEQLAAQHDGQPVAEFRPTPTWRPGEPIADQVALRLPADLPAGVYQLRIGLYDASTQARLPARLADGQTAEFFTGGSFLVK